MPSDTDLHKAANQGDAAEVQELLAEGADVDAPGAQERTALHRALGSGHVEVAQILLEKGADPTVVDSCKRTSARGRDALEPMHTAAPHTFIKTPQHSCSVGRRGADGRRGSPVRVRVWLISRLALGGARARGEGRARVQ